MKPFERFLRFIMMSILVPRFGERDLTSFMDLTYMDHLMIKDLRIFLGRERAKRRDDEDEVPAKNEQNEEVENLEQNNEDDFEREAVNEEVGDVIKEVRSAALVYFNEGDNDFGVDPRLIGGMSDSVFLPLQAELERVRVDKIQAELNTAQAENVRLLALL
ncbi:hypothetical protein Dimus_007948 [Dionaea muscipula]